MVLGKIKEKLNKIKGFYNVFKDLKLVQKNQINRVFPGSLGPLGPYVVHIIWCLKIVNFENQFLCIQFNFTIKCQYDTKTFNFITHF